MKVVFLSGMLNHHQEAFSESMLERCEYHFIATDDISGAGYQRATDADYVVHWYKDEEKEQARKLVLEADVAIFGSHTQELVDIRMNENKLSFIYSERFLKKGTWRRFIPRVYKGIKNRILRYKCNNMYVLCASAYLPYDLSLLKFPKGKTYKWGYFPECKKYENVDALIEQKKSNSILWCGRFIDWKHPEYAIELARRLKADGCDFVLNMIGNGKMFDEILQKVKELELEDNVQILGSMKPEQVRSHMEQSEIFVFTSNKKEGWGAVLNEAMNSACAVVANNAIGSAPYLLENDVNGLLCYKDSIDEFYKKVKFLLDNREKRKEYSKKAYESIMTNWNCAVAADRFIELSSLLLEQKEADLYSDGPCSRANIIKG